MATFCGPHGRLGTALAAAALVACGGPPVGSKAPRPDPTPIAVGAAAAAAALTLANPDLAGQKPSEQDDGRAPRESKEPRVTVPGDVLDRAESAEPDPSAKRPCKTVSTGARGSGVSLVPTADETAPRTAPPPLERPDCAPAPAPPAATRDQ
ncbi:MAG TPA: hypothetical protein VML75_02545 [Kofleriaceae bacterium]|nr:hypothetical protein [Kofleriaceae bacterium]